MPDRRSHSGAEPVRFRNDLFEERFEGFSAAPEGARRKGGRDTGRPLVEKANEIVGPALFESRVGFRPLRTRGSGRAVVERLLRVNDAVVGLLHILQVRNSAGEAAYRRKALCPARFRASAARECRDPRGALEGRGV